MITNNPNPETNQQSSTLHPASVLELDLLFRQRMQELRAEGAAMKEVYIFHLSEREKQIVEELGLQD